VTDIDVMEEAKTRVFAEKIEEIQAERAEAREAKSADELLEEAYNKLSVNETVLKSEIEAYFYGSGYWEEPVVPDPAPVVIPPSEIPLLSQEDQDKLNEDGTVKEDNSTGLSFSTPTLNS